MYCDFVDTGRTNAAGWKYFACSRPGCDTTVVHPYGADRIISNSRGIGGIGPGTALYRMLKRFGAKSSRKCRCAAMARQMDNWNIEGCRKRRGEISRWIRRKAFRSWVTDQFKIGWAMSKEPWFRFRDPLGSLVSEAIRLAEESQRPAKKEPARIIQSDGAPRMEAIVPVDDQLHTFDAKGEPASGLKDLWRGCAGWLVGGGPSVNEFPYHRLAERGMCSLGINGIAGKVPVKAFTASDPAEKMHIGIWRDPGMLKLIPKVRLTRKSHTREKTADGHFRLTGKNIPDYPNVWAYDRGNAFDPDTFLSSTSATYGNDKKANAQNGRPRIIFTLFLALRLMHFLGVRRVYLLGVDFYMDPAKGLNGNYAFDDGRYDGKEEDRKREESGVIDGNNSHYLVASEMLAELRPRFEKAGFFVYNVNPMSRLRCFDHVAWEDALADCRNGVPEGELDLGGWYRKGER